MRWKIPLIEIFVDECCLSWCVAGGDVHVDLDVKEVPPIMLDSIIRQLSERAAVIEEIRKEAEA